MKPPSSVPLVLNAADKEGRICLSLSPSVSTHICVNTVIWRVCVFKMMDRVMLLVNNSPRCRLRSRCPSHLGQSAGIQPALWLEETRESIGIVKLIFISLLFPAVVLSIFLSRLSSSFSPSVCRSFSVKEKWKTSTPSRRQLVGKGINLGLKFFGGQNTEETTSERRDWSPS